MWQQVKKHLFYLPPQTNCSSSAYPTPQQNPNAQRVHSPNAAHLLLLHHGGFFGFQNMVREDPGHGHFDGELDAAAHGQLQEELPKPELGQVTALLQRFWNAEEIPPAGGHPRYPHGDGSEGRAQEAAAAASCWTGFGWGTFFWDVSVFKPGPCPCCLSTL